MKHFLTDLLADFKNACFSLHVGRTSSVLLSVSCLLTYYLKVMILLLTLLNFGLLGQNLSC